MALKADIESREADCSSVQDYVGLAAEALQEPTDTDYAQHLLQRAADQAQFPADHVAVAETALAANLKELADAAYGQAEEFCMEGSEFAAVAVSLARHTDEKDKARALFEQAVKDAGKPEQILAYAAQAKADMGDEQLAASLLDKVKSSLSGLDEFKTLAKTLMEGGDSNGARMLYEQAAGLADDMPGTVDFAAGLIDLFDDRDAAQRILSGLEGECMFPGQFVALAAGFKNLLDDGEKAAGLLEQGKEFAMSGEENLDLANGYAALLQDQETAGTLFEQALNDLSSKDDLMRLAGDMARHLDDKSGAARAYEKAESKTTDPNDLAKLAKAVNDTLGDRSLAAGIFGRATEKLDQPNDLLRLGGEILGTLNDPEAAGKVYRQALDRISELPQLQRLLDTLADGFDDPELAGASMDKALNIADGTAALIDVARRTRHMQLDTTLTTRALDQAEEAVNSLDEMRKLNDAVGELVPDDGQRLERVAAKLAKREASQARYVAFQEREKQLTRADQFIGLAGEVRQELDDPFYARQLLEKANELLDGDSFNLTLVSQLINAVDRLIDDAEWVGRLLDGAAGRLAYFAQLRELGLTAGGLSDSEFGQQWAHQLYQQWEQRLNGDETAGAQEIAKFANAIQSDLHDSQWALRVLEQAEQRSAKPLDLLWLGRYARRWGDDDRAEHCYSEAAGRCQDANDFSQLARQLRDFGEPIELARKLYDRGEQQLRDPAARLRWAEGIVREFGDVEWAGRVYEELVNAFEAGQRSVYDYSRETWLTRNRQR